MPPGPDPRIAIQAARYISEFGPDWFSNPWYDVGGGMAQWDAPYELRRATMIWSRSDGVGPPQDPDMCTFHLLNLTDGEPDATWTEGDYTTVHNHFYAYWQAIKEFFDGLIEYTRLEFRADGPAFTPHGASPHPVLRAFPETGSIVGTGSNGLPPQCAVTVTEVTAATYVAHDVEGIGDQTRNRWGRWYLPAPSADVVANGRLSTATGAALADAAQELYSDLIDDDFVPVVYSPTTGSSWSVDAIHVDDIFDVIRSRRFVTPLTRNSRTIPA